MPPVRISLSFTNYCIYTVALILLLSEVILLYSCYFKKVLVYITIAALSSRQSSFYFKCTFINIHSSYNIRSVFNIKYISYILRHLRSSYFSGKNT